jgi:hypothetical protein
LCPCLANAMPAHMPAIPAPQTMMVKLLAILMRVFERSVSSNDVKRCSGCWFLPSKTFYRITYITLFWRKVRFARSLVAPGLNEDMGVGTSINGDLTRVGDSQAALFDVVDICCFSSPFEPVFGKERAIESGFSASQLQRCERRNSSAKAGQDLCRKSISLCTASPSLAASR